MTHVAGTSIDILRSKKVRSDNKSGYPGVYRMKNGRFRAEITFQSKRYYLGRYDTMKEAIVVRKKAEETLHDEFIRYYNHWKEIAEIDKNWAEENIISITVEKTIDGCISLHITPELDSYL